MVDHRRGAVAVATQLGTLRAEFSKRGLCRLEFRGSPARSGATGSLARQLQAYAAGKPIRFTIPLDLSAGTTFQQAVWRTLLKIPRGETRSYGWVAKQIGKPRATRAVGSACGANSVPIIVPCHRVIAGDGSIGGFGYGLRLKKKLLALEGVKLKPKLTHWLQGIISRPPSDTPPSLPASKRPVA